jgi:hypothetical protein
MRVSKAVVILISMLPTVLFAAEEEQPSLELLEYLGNWEDSNGNWIDPQMLEPATLNVVEKDDETVDKQKDE